MRLVTHVVDGVDRLGIEADGEIRTVATPVRLEEILADGATALGQLASAPIDADIKSVPLSTAVLRPPLRPRSIRDSIGFLQHLRNCTGRRELDAAFAQVPAFYFSNHNAVVAHAEPVEVPPGCEMFDFELEVAAVVGTPGKNLTVDEAWDHIAGYTIYCDWSARDLQIAEMPLGLGPAKGKDSANSLGPLFVTADELEEARDRRAFALSMRAYVNDRLIADGTLADMDWSFGELLAHMSRGTEILPGDVVGSGTVPTGCLMEHYVASLTGGDPFVGWLSPGDTVRLEVDRLGVLANSVVASKAHVVELARRAVEVP
jgi:2-keto-4-pentenoate hydratase/2-oxohepta-3-ene-1,7-dioic acid hydratase in catechol pathway